MLLKLLEKTKVHFEEGGKLHRLYPLFEMVDTILYTSPEVTKGQTHIRDGVDLKRVMTTVILALIPCFFFGLYNTGFQANSAIAAGGAPLPGWRTDLIMALGVSFNPNSIGANFFHGSLYFFPLYIATLVVGGFWEMLFAVVRKHEIGEAFLVTSLLYPMILPPTVPVWEAMFALSIGLVIGKEVFGGTGRNFVNPAIFARATLFFSYPASMTGEKIWMAADGISGATPLGLASASGIDTVSVSFLDAFLGFIPGSMAETSTLACLFGAAVLIITGIGSWRIMLSTVVGMLIVSGIFFMIGSETNPMFGVNPFWHLVLGGFAFGTVFMATDPVSAAATLKGKYIYGFIIGAACALVRVLNPAYPEGMMLAILFGNILAPIIDHYVIKSNIKRRARRVA